MGLDMCLYSVPKGAEPTFDERQELAYWRKANAIHNFFDKWRANGNLRNGEYLRIYQPDLENLRARCQTILQNTSEANNLLPTTRGFFFGSVEYDEWYFKDLQATITHIDKIFNNDVFENHDVYYMGDW